MGAALHLAQRHHQHILLSVGSPYQDQIHVSGRRLSKQLTLCALIPLQAFDTSQLSAGINIATHVQEELMSHHIYDRDATYLSTASTSPLFFTVNNWTPGLSKHFVLKLYPQLSFFL